jgi:hypothetical protein
MSNIKFISNFKCKTRVYVLVLLVVDKVQSMNKASHMHFPYKNYNTTKEE